MKKIILTIFLFTSINPLFSQTAKEELFEQNVDSIMDELRFSYQYEQAMREYILFKTFDKSIIDSLESLEDPREYIFSHNFKTDKEKRIWNDFIHPADDKFTELMINISNKYGYPSLKRIKKHYDGILPSEFDPTILLIHSRKKYWPEINTMVEREFENGNMGKCDYGYIKWHISGRKENSFLKENGIKFAAGDDGQVYYVDSCEDNQISKYIEVDKKINESLIKNLMVKTGQKDIAKKIHYHSYLNLKNGLKKTFDSQLNRELQFKLEQYEELICTLNDPIDGLTSINYYNEYIYPAGYHLERKLKFISNYRLYVVSGIGLTADLIIWWLIDFRIYLPVFFIIIFYREIRIRKIAIRKGTYFSKNY